MPTTALAHFGEDVARARAIVAHADPLPAATPAEQMLRSDLLRSAWMFSVDARYLLLRCLHRYCCSYDHLEESSSRAGVPDFFYNIRFPV